MDIDDNKIDDILADVDQQERITEVRRDRAKERNNGRPLGVKAFNKQDIKRHITHAKRYGLTPHEYRDLLREHDGRCALCHKKAKLCIDHDHATKEVRGLLCNSCNINLGQFENWLKANEVDFHELIRYLG